MGEGDTGGKEVQLRRFNGILNKRGRVVGVMQNERRLGLIERNPLDIIPWA
jgi:hypothetical protein